MSLTPFQIALSVFELTALLAGAALLLRAVFVAPLREATFASKRLGRWNITGFEVTLLIVLIFLLGFIGQALSFQLFSKSIKGAADRAGLEVIAYGLGFHACALLGWPVFALLRRRLYADYGAEPPGLNPAPRMSWLAAALKGAGTLLMALPVVVLLSAGWTALLRFAGLPDEPQDLIAIFGHVKSPLVVLGMFAVACIAGPVNEELLFRHGVFRYLRQRFGRLIAFAASAVCFGALHMNLAGFVPLALLGAALGLAYEATGDIRVPIIAHCLFNLNTIVIVLSGLPGVT
ncbi:MAG: CPBP family intramembrane metalloprotease [Opitutae bacterium]|nr:CPBP family intramembrane metalloprotease [Opitutae bacterium]